MLKRINKEPLLSAACQHLKSFPCHGKLDLFGKGVAVIDILTRTELHSIRQLDLSHNAISLLDNLEQFSNLRILNLSHNKILSSLEFLKLKRLNNLQCVLIKGNPCLKQPLAPVAAKYLLCLRTDTLILGADQSSVFEQNELLMTQLVCFQNYLHRIRIHMQLASEFQMEAGQPIIHFPKIKKIMEAFIYSAIDVKASLVGKIPVEAFEEKQLLTTLSLCKQEMQRQKSELIANIYEAEETLKGLRLKNGDRIGKKPLIHRAVQQKSVKFTEAKRDVNLKLHSNQKEVKGTKQDKLQRRPLKSLNVREDESFDQNYGLTLLKTNPVYHLLHSPLHSLKPSEKDLLIETLSAHLQEKCKEINKLDRLVEAYKYNQQILWEELQESKSKCLKLASINQRTEKDFSTLKEKKSEQDYKMNHICSQIAIMEQRCRMLEKKDLANSLETTKYQDLVNRNYRDEQLEEMIAEKRGVNLQRQHLRSLEKRAVKLASFKYNQQIRRVFEAKHWKKIIFQDMKLMKITTHSQRICTKTRTQKFGKEIIKYLKKDYNLVRLNIELTAFLINKQKKQFIGSLKTRVKVAQKIFQSLKIHNNRQAKRIKSRIFAVLKKQMDARCQISDFQRGKLLRRQLLIGTFYRTWLFSNSLLHVRTAEVAVHHKDSLRSSFISRLAVYYYTREEIAVKSLGLQQFLSRYRRIHYFHILSKIINQTVFQRSLKARRIVTIKLHKYFTFFLSEMRNKRIKKLIKRSQNQHQEQIVKQQQINQARVARQQKDKIRRKFKRLLNSLRFRTIQNCLNRHLKEFYLSNRHQQQAVRTLLANLRTNSFVRAKLRPKRKTLSMLIIQKQAKAVILRMRARNISFSFLLQNYTNHKSKLLQSSSFFQWRLFTLRREVSYYKVKLNELGPEIDLIMDRQRETNGEKILLLRELEDKEAQLRSYEKKIAEFDCLLHSKQMKYEKLKDIYAEAVAERDVPHLQMKATRDFAKYDYKHEGSELNFTTFKQF